MIDNVIAQRRNSLKIQVGAVQVGGGSPISVQSMTNTDTEDVKATLNQIYELQAAGADIVRAVSYTHLRAHET